MRMNHSIKTRARAVMSASRLRSCVGTRRRSLPKVCGCRFLSADVELLRGAATSRAAKCGTCLDRIRAFEANGVTDPAMK